MSERSRPSWDDTWLTVADAIGRRSKCVRASVGCVLVSPDNRALSVAYVGEPPDFASSAGKTDCSEWCPRGAGTVAPGPEYGTSCTSVHAETNAVARVNSVELVGGTAYVSSVCCIECAKLLAAARISRVVTRLRKMELHREPSRSVGYLLDSGVMVTLHVDNGSGDGLTWFGEGARLACEEMEAGRDWPGASPVYL